MVAVEQEYVFDGPNGKATLLDMFEGRRQLIVYHFMFGPEMDEGHNASSILADSVGQLVHLHARDTTLVLASRAPLEKLERFRARMGWTIPWYSSAGNTWNYDYHATTDASVAPVEYNYQDADALVNAGKPWRLARAQRLPPGHRGRVPHLLDVRTRLGNPSHSLQLPRPDAPGTPGRDR
jgi:predicted dithiol-disulfide oxidoreductase (DUF899 family)